MIDFNACLIGFAIGLFIGAVAGSFNNIISGLFGIMKS